MKIRKNFCGNQICLFLNNKQLLRDFFFKGTRNSEEFLNILERKWGKISRVIVRDKIRKKKEIRKREEKGGEGRRKKQRRRDEKGRGERYSEGGMFLFSLAYPLSFAMFVAFYCLI
jgi:hypothetical protein